jgi:hypothetical protein
LQKTIIVKYDAELAPYMRGWRVLRNGCSADLLDRLGAAPTAMCLMAAMEKRSPSAGGIA